MKVAVSSAAGIGVYSQISATTLRQFLDGLFPYFAKFPTADVAPFGKWHRFREGHDLLIDVPNTFKEYGVRDGIRHGAHVILTDFPTKDGIPIPGFSNCGLGQFLVEHGIPRGWLHVNIMEGAVGYFAVAEGSADLFSAASGGLDMSTAVFFDTFVEGSVEVVLGAYTENPFLVLGGIENIAAGVVSTWKTFTIEVDPFEFFGAGLGSAILGALLTFALTHDKEMDERVRTSLCNSARSGMVSALFTVASAFGFGALLGLAAHKLGKSLAARNEQEKQMVFSIDQKQVERFLQTLGEGRPDFWDYWRAIQTSVCFIDSPPLLFKDMAFCFPPDFNVFGLHHNAFSFEPCVLLPGSCALPSEPACRLESKASLL